MTMKLRCGILDDYQNAALTLADWSRIADRVEVETLTRHIDDPEELAERLQDFDILVIMRERTPFREELFARLPRLRLLITTGMRNASVDLEAARSRGVTVCGTPGSSEPTVELTWALLLGLARHVVQENTTLRAGGPWQSTLGTGIHGKRLGLLGLGKIGTRVARVAQAFGMEVAAWSQNLTRERADEAGVQLAPSMEALLESSDFVSIHLVLSERTRGLLGAAGLGRMRPSAYLINTSRSAIIDREALIDALQQGRIAGAGIDVFDVEPLPPGDPFRSLPNLLATPHLGYVSRENYQSYYQGALEDIETFLAGEPLRVLG